MALFFVFAFGPEQKGKSFLKDPATVEVETASGPS
jgi:hypothetical protein